MSAGGAGERGDLLWPPPPTSARVAAVAALLGMVGAAVALVGFVLVDFGVLFAAMVCLGIGVPAAWGGLTRPGFGRTLWVVAGVFLLAAVLLVVWAGDWLPWVLAVIFTTLAASVALRWEVAPALARRWRAVAPATRPVLIMNPKSGGGKVERFGLVEEARKRSIEPIVLGPGDDLRELAERAVQDGADVIGMAGGDGSQAIVASVAAEHHVPFVCIPAGTRNHLALDLGVDRKDVVGALDAFGEAREAAIDLAQVNGTVFVNNVSLGVYAEIVRSDAYRDAKAETVSKMLPELLGPRAKPFDLRLDRPDGRPVGKVQLVMVSNGTYVLDRLGAMGTRPRLNAGHLGVVAVHIGGGPDATAFLALEAAGQVRRFPGWTEWQAPTLVIDSGAPVAAGIDGESVLLDAPLRFTTRPLAVRVRTTAAHPGMSPAIKAFTLGRATFMGLIRVARGQSSGLIY